MAAEMRYEETPVVVATGALFPYPPEATDYLAGPDGHRFLFVMRTRPPPRPVPNVIVNWMSALTQVR